MNLNDVKQFLDENETCVISTASKSGAPEAATVGFSVDDNYKIIIATNENTRKAENLQHNNKVALVVGFSGSRTIQLEGVAKMINQSENQERINLHFSKVPGAKKFATDNGQNYYLITPTWLRMTDYTKNPTIFEYRSFK